jgi:Domain of unknown function (DUF4149)
MIRSASVENVGFDALRFVYHLALACIVGGGLALGSAAAPAIFKTVRSRGEAGTIFGEALRRWDGLAVLCVVLIVVTSALAAGTEVTGTPETRLIVRWIALAVMCLAVIYSSGWANPVARSLRSQTRDWDDVPESTPVRREFNTLHRRSTRAMQVAIVAGLVAMFLS